MESVSLYNQPPQAGAEAAKGSELGVQHLGSLAGANAVGGPVFLLQNLGSSLIPGHIPDGTDLLAAADLGSPAIRAMKKNIMSVQTPAIDVVECVNVHVEISDGDDGEGGEEEEVEVLAIGSRRRKFISPVWMHFERLETGEKWMARCVHCSKKLRAEAKNGTGHLYNHLRSCLPENEGAAL